MLALPRILMGFEDAKGTSRVQAEILSMKEEEKVGGRLQLMELLLKRKGLCALCNYGKRNRCRWNWRRYCY